MNIEIGTDIISISRIEGAVLRFGISFLERFLLPSEILLVYRHKENIYNLCNIDSERIHSLILSEFISAESKFFTQENKHSYLTQMQDILIYLKQNFTLDLYKIDTIAGFWAIKESCAKALGVGIGKNLGFHDMCIYKNVYGKPHLALHENKYKNFNIEKIAVSMSHDLINAIAICVATFND